MPLRSPDGRRASTMRAAAGADRGGDRHVGAVGPAEHEVDLPLGGREPGAQRRHAAAAAHLEGLARPAGR